MLHNENEASKDTAKPSNHKPDRKGGLSCAECRRSKLRCDRAVPCSACVRRGCSAICPDGTLAATKGNKVLQNQNQALQQAVRNMNSRIRDLEAALSSTQAQLTPHPHPLLTEGARFNDAETLALLTSEEPEPISDDIDEATEAMGTMSVGENGQTRFHGQSTASEFLQTLLPNNTSPISTGDLHNLGLPTHIMELVTAFPFNIVQTIPEIKYHLLQFLPHHSKCLELTLIYYENIGCLYQTIPQDEFLPCILHTVYDARSQRMNDQVQSHQIAVLFVVLAIGSYLSADRNGKATSERYFSLACAAMSIDPIVKEANTTTINAIFIMLLYFALVETPSSERRWLVSGLMQRLAYSIGLQRDPAIWDLSPDEIQRRRTLFWEMYSWESFFCILYGRPPALDIRFADCRFPEDQSPVTNANGEKELGFQAYKHRFAAFCLSQVIQYVFNVQHNNYAALVEVDMKLRKFQVPTSLLCPLSGMGEAVDGRAWSTNSSSAMQQYCILCERESTLLYIHRRFVARAINLNRLEPLKTKYGASVMAAYRSACLLLSALRSLHGRHPKTTYRQNFFWSGAFSACVVLGCLVFNSPGCSLVGEASRALLCGIDLYSSYATVEPSAQYSLQLLHRLRDKALHSYETYLREAVIPQLRENDPDCPTMRVLEGSRVVINKRSTSSTSNASSPESQSTRSDSPSISVERSSPQSMPVNNNTPWTGAGYSPQNINVQGSPPFPNQIYDFGGVYITQPEEVRSNVITPAFSMIAPEMDSEKQSPIAPNNPRYMLPTHGFIPMTEDPLFTNALGDPVIPELGSSEQPMKLIGELALPQPPVQHPGVLTSMGMFEPGATQQNGYHGFSTDRLATVDPTNWESFLSDLGIRTS